MDGRRRGVLASIVAAAFLVTAGAPASPTARAATCFGEPATLVGTAGDDWIRGTSGRDVIVGRGGEDVIFGDDGGDRICGGKGIDRLDGRYGDDLVDGGRDADQVLGGPDDDLLLGGPGHDEMEGGDGPGSDTLVGGPAGDLMSGGDSQADADFLFGGNGNDSLLGGAGGRDSLYGGHGNDFLRDGLVSFEFSDTPVSVQLGAQPRSQAVGEGLDSLWEPDGVVGSRFDDTIVDTGEAGRPLSGRGGDDVIDAGGGADDVDGGPGSDQLEGGPGVDFVRFADSPVGVTASLHDATAAGAGTDSLAGFENVAGSFFDDHLTGDDAPNDLYGSYGGNAIFGLGGDDTIDSADEGDAGSGADDCWNAAVANCEGVGHSDPPSLPFVSDPVHGAEIEVIDTVRGGIAGGITRPETEGVLVSIRRMTADGCWWWDFERATFVRGGCEVPLAVRVLIPRNQWSVEVGAALPPGSYRVGVDWAWNDDLEWPPCTGVFAPMCVSFDVR